MNSTRPWQWSLIASTLLLGWLGMQVVHELGHVVTAWAGGESVRRVVLHPLSISRTDVSHDRHPLLVIWGGPVLGSLLPLAALGVSRLCRSSKFYLFQFFAGFCLIANGAYLSVGAFGGVGDAGDLLRFGAPRWALIVFGLVCVPSGLFLWNGLGPHYGLGSETGEVDRRAALGTLGLVLIVVLVECLYGRR
jgi:hypothetical protein